MKKISSSKLLLVFSTIGLLIYSVIYACSDNGDWGWAFDSNFTPETFVDKSYAPLFLSSDVFYGIGFDQEHNTRFNDEIVADADKLSVAGVIRHREYLRAFDSDLNPVFHQEARNVVRN